MGGIMRVCLLEGRPFFFLSFSFRSLYLCLVYVYVYSMGSGMAMWQRCIKMTEPMWEKYTHRD